MDRCVSQGEMKCIVLGLPDLKKIRKAGSSRKQQLTVTQRLSFSSALASSTRFFTMRLISFPCVSPPFPHVLQTT